MLVNYLQTQMLMPNYQDKRLIRKSDLSVAIDFKQYIHDERLKHEEAERFKNMLTEQNLREFEADPTQVRNTMQIDTWMNDNSDMKKIVME